MIKRGILGIFSIILVFFLPWWLVFLIALAFTFYFDKFYEIIIIALLADIIYGSIYFIHFPYPMTLISIVVFYVITRFKNNLIAY